jgi:Uma2 family endonuclease
MPVTHINELDLTRQYTYADYLTWRLQEHVELIKGRVFRMSPAPSTAHQRISRKLTTQWDLFLAGTGCEVFAAPFDVRFPKKEDAKEIVDVVQPDVCVICDSGKLDERGCLGAPDLIIEILSKGNAAKELKNKYELYEANGVQEYWIIHPEEQTILIYTLTDGKYKPSRLYTKGDTIGSLLFPHFHLHLDNIFE